MAFDRTRAGSVSSLLDLGSTSSLPSHKDYKSVWVFGSVRAISNNIAGVPFGIREVGNKTPVTDRSNPYVRLFSRPNQLVMTLPLLWKLTSIYYELFGGAFWVYLDDSGNPYSDWSAKRAPSRIMVHPAYDFEPHIENRHVPGKPQVFKGWKSAKYPNVSYFDTNQVVRFFEIDPSDPFSQVSPRDIVAATIGIDEKAHNYNDKFFTNGAQPMGYLMDESEDSLITDSERKRMQQEWDANYAGSDNAHRTPFMQGGVKYVPTGITQKDMDFQGIVSMSKEEILAAFNVPENQLGISKGMNFATAKISDRQFFTNNLIPKMEYFASLLNSTLFYDTPYECYFEFTAIEPLKDERKDKILGAMDLYELGFSLNEINRVQELGMDDVKESWANENVDVRGEGLLGWTSTDPDRGAGETASNSDAGAVSPSKQRERKRALQEWARKTFNETNAGGSL